MRLPAAPLILLGAMVVLLLGGGVALAKTITGTNGPDTLIGTAGPDQISALRGGDYVDGMQGDDALYGNQGNDRVLGRAARTAWQAACTAMCYWVALPTTRSGR